jgi:hypothetical protein
MHASAPLIAYFSLLFLAGFGAVARVKWLHRKKRPEHQPVLPGGPLSPLASGLDLRPGFRARQEEMRAGQVLEVMRARTLEKER